MALGTYKMGAAADWRANGCRTSTNNNSVQTGRETAGADAFLVL